MKDNQPAAEYDCLLNCKCLEKRGREEKTWLKLRVSFFFKPLRREGIRTVEPPRR